MDQQVKNASLEAGFHRMTELSRSAPPASLAERLDRLTRLRAAVADNEARFSQAISADFGHRSQVETSIAEVLFGDVNPGAKLPVSVVRDVGQVPYFYDHKPSAERGYLFATTDPLFAFGHGLSYTRFEIGTPVLSASRIARDGTVTVAVEVANRGARAGDEVVQL